IHSQSSLPASCTSSCFMLIICSSLARNRSPDLVVSCCFGRIVTSDAVKESWFAKKENRKTKLQGSRSSGREILQSQIAKSPKNRLTFSRLAVVHGRLGQWRKGRRRTRRHKGYGRRSVDYLPRHSGARAKRASPESRDARNALPLDSGSAPSARPGMT